MVEQGFQLSSTAMTLWWIILAVTALVLVPLAWYLLHRTWQAARSIQDYTERALDSGLGIADNTRAVAALEETVSIADAMAGRADRLADGASGLRALLLSRAREGGGS